MENLAGLRFGRLQVIGNARKHNRNYLWECLCDCGNKKEILSTRLKSGKTKSCGCLRTELLIKRSIKHGNNKKNSRTTEYVAWFNMKSRCYNKNNNRYKNYGARGITVCERWVNSFENFILDMGKKPTTNDKLSIDRINNNGNYEPSNCKWSTHREQTNNKRQNGGRKHDAQRDDQKSKR